MLKHLAKFYQIHGVLLEIALAKGMDFDKKNGNSTIRLSFSSDSQNVLEGVKKIAEWLKKNY